MLMPPMGGGRSSGDLVLMSPVGGGKGCHLWEVGKVLETLWAGLYLKPSETTKILSTYLSCHNFFSLSSVQIIIVPACCLLCVL